MRPSLPELEVTLPSFISRPSSFPVEYRGPTARHGECRCSITTSTRYRLTLSPGISLSLCPRSLALTEEEDRASQRTRLVAWRSFLGAHGAYDPPNE